MSATRKEISDITHAGKQWSKGSILTLEELKNLEGTITVWVEEKVWNLAPIKYTECFKLKHTKAESPEFNTETRQVERKQINLRKTFPLDSGIEIREAVELEDDDRLFPVSPSEAYLPIRVTFDEFIKFNITDDDMPYLDVINRQGEVFCRVVYFGKTERYIIYALPGEDSPEDELLGAKIAIKQSAGEVINYLRDKF